MDLTALGYSPPALCPLRLSWALGGPWIQPSTLAPVLASVQAWVGARGRGQGGPGATSRLSRPPHRSWPPRTPMDRRFPGARRSARSPTPCPSPSRSRGRRGRCPWGPPRGACRGRHQRSPSPPRYPCPYGPPVRCRDASPCAQPWEWGRAWGPGGAGPGRTGREGQQPLGLRGAPGISLGAPGISQGAPGMSQGAPGIPDRDRLKALIAGHPLYADLLRAHVECLKVRGGPPRLEQGSGRPVPWAPRPLFRAHLPLALLPSLLATATPSCSQQFPLLQLSPSGVSISLPAPSPRCPAPRTRSSSWTCSWSEPTWSPSSTATASPGTWARAQAQEGEREGQGEGAAMGRSRRLRKRSSSSWRNSWWALHLHPLLTSPLPCCLSSILLPPTPAGLSTHPP